MDLVGLLTNSKTRLAVHWKNAVDFEDIYTGDEIMVENGLKGLWLEITKACNLSCSHCGNNSGPHQPLTDAMTVDDWKRVIGDSRTLGAGYLQFIGGEPTVHPHLMELIEHAKDLGFEQIDVFSNATRITEAMAYQFAKLNVSFAVSVYGATPEIHAHFTNSLRSHGQTERGINLLRQHGVPVRAGIVVDKQTIGTVDDTKRYLESLGVTNVHVDQAREVGRLDTQGGKEEDFTQLCGRCGQDMLNITATGDVFPCLFSIKSPIGNLVDASLAEIMEGRDRQTFRERLISEKSGVQALCPPYSCNPEHSCVPHTSSPHCGPDFCFPGRGKADDTAVNRIFHRS